MKAAELTVELRTLAERVENVQRDQQSDAADLKRLDATVRDLQSELAATCQDNAVLRQRIDDHLKRYELWEARRWAFVMALIGAVLSLASGLIVTLVRVNAK